jgi:O-antigen ligase
MSYTIVQPIIANRAEMPMAALAARRERAILIRVLAFFAAHVLLALVARQVKAIITVHALATLSLGLWWALSSVRRPERVAYMGAYITGAEILWRMSSAGVFWEMGKYATSAIFIVAMLRSNRLKGPSLPLLYFLLLIPSILLTIDGTSLGVARGKISFNLSGPLALFVSAWFFSHLRLTTGQLRLLLLAAVAPLIGVATRALAGTLAISELKFMDGSMRATSGGFGPNQVSALLGFGALLAFICLLIHKSSLWPKLVMIGIIIFLGIQSAMTFSRGGLYMAAGGAVVASIFMLKDSRLRIRVIVFTGLFFIIVNFAVLPRLDNFTGGALSTRFTNTDLTKRDDIIWADLEIWKEHPFVGVGPGMAQFDRQDLLGRDSAAHTEFSRLLAEHGLLGATALFLLLIIAYRNFRGSRTDTGKSVVACLTGWSFLFMYINAMRLVAPAFAFALGFATILPDRPNNPKLPAGDQHNRPAAPTPVYRPQAALGHRMTGSDGKRLPSV